MKTKRKYEFFFTTVQDPLTPCIIGEGEYKQPQNSKFYKELGQIMYEDWVEKIGYRLAGTNDLI